MKFLNSIAYELANWYELRRARYINRMRKIYFDEVKYTWPEKAEAERIVEANKA